MLTTALTILCLFLFSGQSCALSTECAESFVLELASDGEQLDSFHHPQELALSTRLGITYDSVPHKFMLGYDLSPQEKGLILESNSNWSIAIENHADGWATLHLNFASGGNERIFYFLDDYFVTPIRYFSRGFGKLESRFFRFLIEEPSVFHPAAGDALDSFVLEAAGQLQLDEKDLALLEHEKILYLHCRDPESIELFTGFKIRGMGVLSHDCIITTFNAHYHEVAHLLIALKLRNLGPYSHPLLGEGLAVALGGRGGRDASTVLDVGYFLLRSGMVDLDVLLNEKSFIEEEVSFSYPAAGLYVSFLLESMGSGPFVELYRKYCRSGNSNREFSLNPDDIPDKSLWSAWLENREQFESVQILEELPKGGQIVLERDGVKIIDCAGKYCFQLSGDILFRGKKITERYESTRFKQLYPEKTYNGERYLIAVRDGEIGIYDLYLNTLLANRVTSFAYPPDSLESIFAPVIFSADKSLFSIPLQEITPVLP